MAQFKVLSLLIAATISLTNKCSTMNTKYNCETIVISNRDKKVELSKADFLLTENISGYELSILNTSILQEANTLESPEIHFCVSGKEVVAKGNPLFNSSVPKDAECFYGLSNKNKIQLSSGNKILLIMSNKVSKK